MSRTRQKLTPYDPRVRINPQTLQVFSRRRKRMSDARPRGEQRLNAYAENLNVSVGFRRRSRRDDNANNLLSIPLSRAPVGWMMHEQKERAQSLG